MVQQSNSYQHAPEIVRSIVIPCYNERTRLPATLHSVQEYVARHGVASEIIVVDDGSDDGTADWARAEAERDNHLRVVSYGENQGKGYAVKVGVTEAKGEYILFMDADGATPIEEADHFWSLLEQGKSNMVIGSRRSKGAQIRASQKLFRRWASSLYAFIVRILVLRGVQDTQCGFKAMTNDAARQIFSRLTLSSAIFDIEMLIIAQQRNLKVLELPVRWQHDEESRLTYNAGKSLRIFMELLKLKWKYKILWPRKI